jgi:hypothetical protein
MMEAVRTSETSVDNHSTRQYNPEDSSEHHQFLLLGTLFYYAFSVTGLYSIADIPVFETILNTGRWTKSKNSIISVD